MDDVVVGVLGASGGLGTSSLAVALALRAGDRFGVAVAVDRDLDRGGLDVTACVEHQPGLRWGDLMSLEGAVDGPGLLRNLPSERNARFLAAGGGTPDEPVVCRVVTALAAASSMVVLDLGSRLDAAGSCSAVVLLCGTSVRQLADGAAVADGLYRLGLPAMLVLRSAGRSSLDPEEVAYHLDVPLLGTLRHDARVPADADRGRPPGSRATDAVARVADLVLGELDPTGRPADGDAGGRFIPARPADRVSSVVSSVEPAVNSAVDSAVEPA